MRPERQRDDKNKILEGLPGNCKIVSFCSEGMGGHRRVRAEERHHLAYRVTLVVCCE